MDYEEYMRNVLGYNKIPNNIYTNTYDNYYYDVDYTNNSNNANTVNTVNTEVLESMYPEIYRIIYPMVCKSCRQNSNSQITNDLVEKMTEEIYLNVEPEERQNIGAQPIRTVLKNGDVRNPNSKEPETRGETRQIQNSLLRDLIRILILREFGGINRPRPFPPQRPPMPPPPRPNMIPPYAQRPPWSRY